MDRARGRARLAQMHRARLHRQGRRPLASYRWHYFKTSCDAEPAVRFEARVDCTQDMAGDIKVSQRDSLFRQWQEAKALRRSVDWLESRWICGIKDAMDDP